MDVCVYTSPDDITANGVMLEIKCPFTRQPTRLTPTMRRRETAKPADLELVLDLGRVHRRNRVGQGDDTCI